MMPTMRAMAAAALEASSAAIRSTITATIGTAIRSTITATIGTAIRSTVAAAMGSIGTPVRASSASAETAAITAAVASAALWALEAGTRIGANAGKIFAWRAGIARTAGLSWQKHGVIFYDCFDRGAVRRDRSRHGFGRNVLDGFVVRKVSALGFSHLLAIFC
jgi:hypothetical protein